jgi:hypothetical protein
MAKSLKYLTWGGVAAPETCKRTLPALQPKQPVKVQARAGAERLKLIQNGNAKIGININIYI